MREYVVTADENGSRADKIAGNRCKDIGYVLMQKIFRTRKVKVNGKNAKASDRLQTGDVLRIVGTRIPSDEGGSYSRGNISPGYERKLSDQFRKMIIFENKDWLAINTPPGLAVQLGTKISVCIETLMKACREIAGCDCRLVHRLDKDTSGVLLIAKNLPAARTLTAMFKNNLIKKTYIAVVDGKIDISGCADSFVSKTLIGNEEKMKISENGQRIITKYRPLEMQNAKNEFVNCTMLELKPSTGRKHQLRVHCAEILHAPILGDVKYNPDPRHNRLFLHASEVEINDGINPVVKIIAPLPDYFPEQKK
jgi:23S rRNA pseudouridine955/2504/2580 synthase